MNIACTAPGCRLRRAPGIRGYAQVRGRRRDQCPIDPQEAHQDEPCEQGTDQRPDSVGGVEPTDAHAGLVGAPHRNPAEHREGAADQRRRHEQKHERRGTMRQGRQPVRLRQPRWHGEEEQWQTVQHGDEPDDEERCPEFQLRIQSQTTS